MKAVPALAMHGDRLSALIQMAVRVRRKFVKLLNELHGGEHL